MIYQPRQIVNLRTFFLDAVIQTILLVFEDYIRQENKPWYYYGGVLLGETISATGIPAASATVYIAATLAKFHVERGPDGAQIAVFLDGVQTATYDAYAETIAWEFLEVLIPNDGRYHAVELRCEVNPNGAKTSLVQWMALGVIEVVNGFALNAEGLMADILSFRLKDSESDTATTSVPVYFPSTVFTYANYQAWANAFVPELDALTGSQITEITVQMSIPVVGGKSSPVALYLNERGGLIPFDTSGTRSESFRIPAILASIMAGNEFNVTVNPVLALVTRLTTPTVASMQPITPFGYNWLTAIKGVKSFRK